ncbi:hypothetical protein LTR91_003005 [Friedmanniomyces endolithicus]|uniref:Heterokaryon incompatibility domain-containing protein n=1 Tax=Friedmanniomyces endolithicus TaxID=329885 RepID=A0AAN6KYN8_9PEZI|nr:hypothetical protein LTR35_004026 [Friedmanniomyces endolithicus]KAK0300154.1 hypothetical protein LTS00_001226 [Friedmanniomyces endolithicus]KAK0325042.1 hypothetical protein LTR82_004028 [Friedmanniomyces endolithicus]KAK0927834.1 hypothetical protein LTR57_003077 [Friedmanniomyces endolithicus]KAK0999459.1 hypothetical protein LTR54_009204 [Friedmanniomyces endolithicus]
MTICAFCQDHFFLDATWKSKAHHTDASTWIASVASSCTICCLLLTQVKAAVSQRVHAEEALRLKTVTDADLLQHLAKYLPFYNVTLQEAAARKQDRLLFTQRGYGASEDDANAIIAPEPWGDLSAMSLASQTFLVYSADNEDPPRKLSDATDIDLTLPQIQNWFKQCKAEHKYCRPLWDPPEAVQGEQKSRKTPSRLLDVGIPGTSGEMGVNDADVGATAADGVAIDLDYTLSICESDSIRLVETISGVNYHPYATLSHCWGKVAALRMLESNHEEFLLDIKLSSLSRTFQDAIAVTRSLRIRYLWIDSLCIMQDSKEDWHNEAACMKDVYNNSCCNLAAANSENGTEGFFRHRRATAVPPSITRVKFAGKDLKAKVVRSDFWSGELLAEPLYRRAWVVQERLLAPRTLHFGKNQVFWQCLSTTACESMPGGVPRAIGDAGREELQWRQLVMRTQQPNRLVPREQAELQRVWKAAVENYTRCQLTKGTDKLVALAGIAAVVGRVSGEKYIAGMWQTELIQQLSWRVVGCRGSDGSPSKRQQPGDYRGPSWAWASVDGCIEVPPRVWQRRDYTLQIVKDPQPGLVEENAPYGQLKDGCEKEGCLVVRGQMYEMEFCAVDSVSSDYVWTGSLSGGSTGTWCRLYPDEPLTRQPGSTPPGPAKDAATHDGAQATQTGGSRSGLAKATSPEDEESVQTREAQYPILMLTYTADAKTVAGLKGTSGYGLALRRHEDGASFCRVGLVEFRSVSKAQWGRIQSLPVHVPYTQDIVLL